MFNCEHCGKTQKPGTKQINVVLATRPKTYYNENSFGKIVMSQGNEIIQEMKIGPCCEGEVK